MKKTRAVAIAVLCLGMLVVFFKWFVLSVAYTMAIFLAQGLIHYVSRGRSITFTLGTSSVFGVMASTLHVSIQYLLK